MKSTTLFWLHAIMALTWALGTLVFPKERPSLLPLPIRTMSCVLLNSAYLITPGSRARLLGPRKFGLSRMSLSGIVLCLQHQTGQLPQGLASGRTAARLVSASLGLRFVPGLTFSPSLLMMVSDVPYAFSITITITALLSVRSAVIIRVMVR